MTRYLVLLRPRSHRRPFLAAAVGRLMISMGPLSAVLAVRASTGSYSLAGLVAAALAVGLGIGSPVLGRLVDRLGQRPVVAGGAMGSAGATAFLAVAAVGGAAVPVLVTSAFLAGAMFPPLTACMRAAWQHLLVDPAERQSAYALEAVGVELIFIIGPVIVSALLLTPYVTAPLLATAAATLLGGVTYAFTHVAGSLRPNERVAAARPRGGALRGRGVVAILVAYTLVSVAFGTLDVSLAATAENELGDTALVGVLFTVLGAGSVAGGLWYGNRSFSMPQRQRLVVTFGVFAVGLAPLSFVTTSTVLLLIALFVAGLGIAPGGIVSHQLLDDTAPPGTRTEAQAWSSTANIAGAASGTALAGVLVDLGGTSLSLRVAPLAALAAMLLVVACQRVLIVGPGVAVDGGPLPAEPSSRCHPPRMC